MRILGALLLQVDYRRGAGTYAVIQVVGDAYASSRARCVVLAAHSWVEVARRLIAIRVDPDVLKRFQKEARRRKIGYQTLINEVLAQHVGKDVA